MTSRAKPETALHRLYQRQQPKVRASERKAALLRHFAEDDYRRIAQLIGRWLDQDDKQKPTNK